MTGHIRARRAAVGIAGLAAALAIGLSANAGASSDHFSVISTQVGMHRTADGFRFSFDLLNPANRSNNVGYGRGVCRDDQPKVTCKLYIHLDGSIGGFGDVFAEGNLGHGDHTLNLVDGGGDFSGRIGGTLVIDSIDGDDDLWTFALKD
jgi:hypothetical protein